MAPAGSRGLTQDDPVGAVLQEPPHGRQLRALLVAAGAEQQPVALGVGGGEQPVEGLGEERVVEVVEQHGDHPGLAAGQAPRHRVRGVAELVSRGQDTRRDARR